jgi:hypothetical protein
MSRSKEAVYRESGEADYDEAGSPRPGQSGEDESTKTIALRPERGRRPSGQ